MFLKGIFTTIKEGRPKEVSMAAQNLCKGITARGEKSGENAPLMFAEGVGERKSWIYRNGCEVNRVRLSDAGAETWGRLGAVKRRIWAQNCFTGGGGGPGGERGGGGPNCRVVVYARLLKVGHGAWLLGELSWRSREGGGGGAGEIFHE